MEEPQPAESCSRLPVAWPECTEYLYGVDLFNRAYLWEAHEAWELVWIAAGKIGEPAGFVQSLIQIAAALLRQHLETPRGARNLLARADRRLDDLHRRLLQEGEEWYCGVSVGSWRRAVADFLDREQAPYPFLILERGESRASSGPGS